MTFVVACGLRREARIIERPGSDILVLTGGGNHVRLEAELDDMVQMFPVIILSAGLAGALDPSLRSGDLVIDGNASVVDHFRLALPHARVGRILGSDTIVATAATKRALASSTGALAVDMESHVAARVAARRHFPFAAIRAISDTAHEDLPPAALVGMRPDGSVALGAVFRSLLRSPSQLPALIRTGRQAETAFRSIESAFTSIVGAGLDQMGPHDFD